MLYYNSMTNLMNQSTRSLKLLFVVLLVMYFYRSFTLGKPKPIAKKSLLGKSKDFFQEKTATHVQLTELDSLRKRFVNATNNKPDWEILVAVGDIYRFGTYPHLQPDDQLALQIYNVAAKSPCPKTSSLAISKSVDIRATPLSREDRMGNVIPASYAQDIVRAANTYIKLTPDFKTNITTKANTYPTVNPCKLKKAPEVPVPEEAPVVRNVRWGSQIVHDHGVTSATKTNIKRLAENFNKTSGKSLRPDAEVVEEAMELCREKSAGDKLADAHHVVVSLSPDEYSGTGVSQIQILDMVLWKISTIPDQKVRQNVRETLCKRLSSGFENGIVVCGTGKVSRIISVFEGVLEDIQKGVSINLVEKEISNLALKVRDDFLNSVGPLGRKAYECDNSVPEYAVAMSNILKTRVKEEYVEKLNMEESVVNPLVDVYADAY